MSLHPNFLMHAPTSGEHTLSATKKAVFRGGGEGSFDPSWSLADVIRYETEELGNNDVTPLVGNPETVSMRGAKWITLDASVAAEYGEVETLAGDYKLVAKDGQDGYIGIPAEA